MSCPFVRRASAAPKWREFAALKQFGDRRGTAHLDACGGVSECDRGELRGVHGGAVILNGLAVAVKAAETAVDLRRKFGTEPSRASTFIPPTEAALKTLFS